MKLKKLKIKGFKNLTGENGWFTLDFTDKDGITVLIGNNGSGKSNIIEAISIIFIELKIKKDEYDINYTLEYEIENKYIKILRHCGNYSFFINNIEKTTLSQEYLPTKVIASYSGESYRLWNIYEEQYYDNGRKKISLQDKSFLYVDLDDVDIHTLSTIYNEIYEVYTDNNIEKIEKLQEKYKNLSIKIHLNSYHKGLVKNQKLMLFINQITNNDIKITLDSLVSYYNSNLPNEKQDFLKYLLNCNSRRLIKEFDLEEVYELSEGEKKLKLMELIFDILAEKNTLILLDEPDAHIHIANKKLLEELAHKNYEIDNEVVITTHSPTLTHQFDDKHIVMLNNGKIENKSKQEIFSHITDGIWNYQEQSIFLSSQKDIILLVEGKHDKIHIEEAFKRLKSEYPELSFDIFSTDGANNLKQFAIGFANTDYNFEDKKIIAIFDDDKDGQSGMSKNNFDFIDNNNKIITRLKANSKFFGFLLPKRDNFKAECTIENMYPSIKYKDAFKKATENRLNSSDFFTNKSIDKISKLIKDDAKNILAENCRNFEDIDFEHFKKIFDLILEIKDF